MKSKWYGVGVMVLALLLSAGHAWGQCSQAVLNTYNQTYGGSRIWKIWWQGTGLATPIPNNMIGWDGQSGYSVIPLPGDLNPVYNYHLISSTNTACSTFPGEAYKWIKNSDTQYTLYILIEGMGGMCGSTWEFRRSFVYVFSTQTASTKDYDCDGLKDNVDPWVPPWTDSDNDGVYDSVDPWPNDPTKPGNIVFVQIKGYKRLSDGKEVMLWGKKDDRSNEDYWFYTSDGTATPGDVVANPDNYRTVLVMGGRGKTWNQINPSATGSGSGFSTEITAYDTKSPQYSTGGSSGGDTGTRTPSEGSTNDFQAMFDYLQGIQRNTRDANQNLIELVKIGNQITRNQIAGLDLLSGLGGPSGSAEIDLSGVESRIDTTNSKLDTTNNLLNDMVGNPSDLPSHDYSSIPDNSDISREGMAGYLESEKSRVTSKIGELMNSGSPVVSLLNSSGVEYSGMSSVISASTRIGDFYFDFSTYESVFNIMGLFFVSFCGLAGLVDFIRG